MLTSFKTSQVHCKGMWCTVSNIKGHTVYCIWFIALAAPLKYLYSNSQIVSSLQSLFIPFLLISLLMWPATLALKFAHSKKVLMSSVNSKCVLLHFLLLGPYEAIWWRTGWPSLPSKGDLIANTRFRRDKSLGDIIPPPSLSGKSSKPITTLCNINRQA